MTGKPQLNYPEFFRVEERLRKAGFDVLNPALIDTHFPKDCGHIEDLSDECVACAVRTWGWYMRHSLRMLLEADAVALLDGCEDSRGAVCEYGIAQTLGMRSAHWFVWEGYGYDKP